MRNIGFPFVILFFCMGIALFPRTGSAALTALTEAQMRETTAQSGISISASDKMELDLEIGYSAFGDDDGTGDGNGAYISFNDISLKGVITMADPVSIDISAKATPFENAVNSGLDLTINDVTIDIEHHEIGSITVGPEVGTGKSFGSFSMGDYHAHISGNLRIWAH